MSIDIFTADQLDSTIAGLVLVMARFTAFFFVSPFFSKRAMGKSVRFGFILSLAFICTPPVANQVHHSSHLEQELTVLVIKELFLGSFLGVLTWLPIRGLEFVGVFLDTQRGSTQAQDYDVIFSAQTTPTAIFMSQTFSAFFFSSGGLLMVLTILFESTQIWQPAASLPEFSSKHTILTLQFAGTLFATALAIVIPISGFMIMADIVIAFLARSAQSLNALTFGMPVKTAILLVLLYFYIEVLYPNVMTTFSDALTILSKVLQ